MDRNFEAQLRIEEEYSRHHIDRYIREFILSDVSMIAKTIHGVSLIQEYMDKDYSYVTKSGEKKQFTSKINRIKQLENMDLSNLVIDIFVGIAYCQRETLFTSITAQLASRLKFSDKLDAIKTVAELVAVLCVTDAFDVLKANKMASMMVKSCIPLSEELISFIENSQYLPPMVCEPLELENNYASGYLTHRESLILGSGNHHDGDLCLDVLNTMNRVALKLDTDFLSTVEEEPTFDLDTPEKMEQWGNFKKQSYKFYLLMTSMGNQFWLTHRTDKRGRIYSSGFHISSQGSSFKKASIELYNTELVTGVP